MLNYFEQRLTGINIAVATEICRSAQNYALIGFGLLLFLYGTTTADAQETAQCYAPLPSLNLESVNDNGNEFGLRTSPAIEALIAPGQSSVYTDEHAIVADEISFSQKNGTIKAKGDVQIIGQNYQIDADYANVNRDEDRLEISQSEFGIFVADKNDPSIRYKRARGSAQMVKIEDGVLYFESSEFTHCPDGNDDVMLSASELVLDSNSRQGVARNTTVRFKGTPILPLPYLRFPIGADRLSGFLFPTLSSSDKLGYGVEVPYYFNLAPNRDATLTPKYYSKRGFQLESEYRYLGAYSDMRFIGEYMPRDNRYVNRDRRYGAEFVGNLHDGGSLYANFDVSWVSDKTFIDDYSGVFSDQDRKYQVQNASLSYADYGLAVSTGISKFITSSPTVKEDKEPYNREPWFSIDYTTPLTANSAFTTGWVWDKFKHEKHEENPAARRFRGDSAFSVHLANAYSKVDFKVGGEYLRYKLTKPENNQSDRMTVNSKYASLDGRLYFDNSTATSSGKLWTLVPRIKLLATDSDKQENLPDFDTTLSKMESYDRLFQDSPYIGGDRLADTDQVSVGLSAHYSDLTNSESTGSIGFGRVYYPDGFVSSLEEPEVEKPKMNGADSEDEMNATPPANQTEIKKSDLFFETKLENSSTNFQYSALFSSETNKISASSMRLSHAFMDDAEFTSLFRHQRDGKSLWGNAISVNFDSNWTANLKVIRSLDPNELEQASIAFDYASCCSRLGLEIKREQEVDGSYDNSFYLIFDLTPRR